MRNIFLVLGYLLVISAFFRIFPVAVAIIYGEDISGFVLTGIISAALGLLFLAYARMDKSDSSVGPEDALIVAAASFLIIPSIGAITFLPSFNYNLMDALFESFSGFTTTGLSVYPTLDGLPKSLIFWHSQIQWMGGLGIIVIFLLIFSHFPTHSIYAEQRKVATGKSLYAASGYPRGMGPSISTAANRLIILYFSFTLAGIILMAFSGISIFESIALTFSSLSTGGFGVSDDFSYHGFQLLAISLVMLVGSLPFNLYALMIWEKSGDIFRNMEVRSFFVMLILLSFLGFLIIDEPIEASFLFLSAVSTTGYSTADLGTMPPLFISFLFLAMFVGGCTASTSGGVKQVRVVLMVKSIFWALRKVAAPPSEVINLKFARKIMEDKDLLLVLIFIIMNFNVLMLGALVLQFTGQSLSDSLFLAISALGTVGLSTIPLHDMPGLGKSALILIMVLGRLELFPIFLLVRNIVNRLVLLAR